MIKAALIKGFDCVVVNYVGMAGIKITVSSNFEFSKSPRLYDAANTSDLAEAAIYIRNLNKTRFLGAAGISLGGSILANVSHN